MRYAKYKPTGIAWLPEVPEGWEWILNQFLFKENIRAPSARDVPLSLSQADGLIPTDDMKEKSLKTSTYDGWKQVWVGDLVLNRFKAHLGVFFASKYKGMVSFHYGVFARRRDLLPQYYEYLYHTPQYKFVYSWVSKGMTVGLQNLSNTDFYKVRSPYPPVDTQRAIVAYLDEKCGKVDRLVVAKEKEAALLKELKQSMIAEAVTRGVRPKRRLVPSGIPWLPEVPEGWKLVRNKTFLKLTDEKVGSRKNAFTLLSLTKQGVIVRDLTEMKGKFPKDFDTYLVVRPNNLVFCLFDVDETPRTVGLVKNVGMLTGAYTNFEVDQSVVLPEFAYYYYLHVDDAKKLRPYYTGLRKVVKTNTFMQLRMPVPSLDEQREIVAHIEARAAKIDAAVAGLEREVAALKEYKQRLIADVVTGQQKVA